MALKSHYPATNRGEKAFIKDAEPGDLLYVIHEHAGNWGPAKSFSEYVVTDQKNFWPSPGYKVMNTVTKGLDSMTGLLRRERDIYGECPEGMPQAGINPSESDFDHIKAVAAQRVADIHAKEVAQDLAAHYKRLARR